MSQGGDETGRASQAEGTACTGAQRLDKVSLRNGNVVSLLSHVQLFVTP